MSPVAPLFRVFFVVAFGTQTDEISIGIRQLWEEFSRFYVVNMGGCDSPPITPAFPALEAIPSQNLDPLTTFWVCPARVSVVKSHRQNKKSLNHAQHCCHGLGSKASIGY